jgi:ATP/maltotriose-dependent transcriptional regulator MalT
MLFGASRRDETMSMTDTLNRGRESFARQSWGDARARLVDADRTRPLDAEDLELLAVAAYLVGDDDASVDAWARAHQSWLQRGELRSAARCAFWISFRLMLKGDMAQSGGWLSRAQRLLADGDDDCVEQGYLLIPAALASLGEGDGEAGYLTMDRVGEFGSRFGDADLVTLGCLGRGQALILMGDARRGVALLDEAMAAVMAGEVSPTITGIVYCAVIEACHTVMDVRRAHEWTAALTRWCESQPDLVPYRGQCLVHRSEIMRFKGAWGEAMDEVTRACEALAGEPAIGAAFYQRAELHRLRGEFEAAEEAYGRASEYGRSAQPGLAQLRLAQHRVDAALASIRNVVDIPLEGVPRARVLEAYVEILLAAGDLTTAREAADELSSVASEFDVPLMRAVAADAGGAVLMAEGDPRGALVALRIAWDAWRELDAPYEAARTRVLLGLACRHLGDRDGADLELDAARRVFEELGAVPDLGRTAELVSGVKQPGGLTAREVEVLALVATGMSNRAIADALVISEKTVARHLSNIFIKLDLSSRSAATAYAYEHGLT